MAAITSAEYIDLIFNALDLLKTEIIAPNSPGSRIVTRYITSEGADDEQWLAKLRDEDSITDIWLLTVNLITGKNEVDRQMDSVGTFTKPIGVVIDYFYDYKQGLDYTANESGDTLTTNSEREFLEHLFAVDLGLEKKKGCLGGNIRINGWGFRLKIKRFVQSSTHWASGSLNLEIQDIIL